MKLKRIKISLVSAYRYCTRGYWNNLRFDRILFGLMDMLFILFKIIAFPIYVLFDIIFSILVAPFMKQVDKFEEYNKN